jgi:uncharacterized integral membrane protein
LIIGLILGIALVDFLVQNTRSVRIEFFSISGQVPIVVALLVAALAGAALSLIVGGARIRQLHHRISHPAKEHSTHASSGTEATSNAGEKATAAS